MPYLVITDEHILMRVINARMLYYNIYIYVYNMYVYISKSINVYYFIFPYIYILRQIFISFQGPRRLSRRRATVSDYNNIILVGQKNKIIINANRTYNTYLTDVLKHKISDVY